MFVEDGTSVSWGTHAEGALLHGAHLALEGPGYVIGKPWRDRGRNHGTDELVGMLRRASAAVAREIPGSRALIGDLSGATGGASTEHRSHQSGRDADVFFFAIDAAGRPRAPGAVMFHFGADGRAASWSPPAGVPRPRGRVPDVRFDVRRNWALVRQMLSDPVARVQWIFAARPLADLMLAHAEANHEDEALVARARDILHQPTDSQPHDDHMHVRVHCAVGDRAIGCSDRGPVRWWKKRWKYMDRPGAQEGFPDRLPAATPVLARSVFVRG